MRAAVRQFGIAAVVMLAVAGCGPRSTPAEERGDKMYLVKREDPRMNAAIAHAKSTVSTFIAVLKSPRPGQRGFSVKMPFTDHGFTEHFWLTPVSFDGKVFHGVVNNAPEKVTNVSLGQEVTVEPSEISDWMYLEKGVLVGGFTMRAIRDGMSPAERADFDANLPFKIR